MAAATSTLSLAAVDECLHKLSQLSKEDEQVEFFRLLCQSCTPDDLKMVSVCVCVCGCIFGCIYSKRANAVRARRGHVQFDQTAARACVCVCLFYVWPE